MQPYKPTRIYVDILHILRFPFYLSERQWSTSLKLSLSSARLLGMAGGRRGVLEGQLPP